MAVRYVALPIYKQRHWFGSISNQETYHTPDFQPLAQSYITKTQHSFKLFHNIGVCIGRRGGGNQKQISYSCRFDERFMGQTVLHGTQ